MPVAQRTTRVTDDSTPIAGMCTDPVSNSGHDTTVLYVALKRCDPWSADVIIGQDFLSPNSTLIDCAYDALHLELPSEHWHCSRSPETPVLHWFRSLTVPSCNLRLFDALYSCNNIPLAWRHFTFPFVNFCGNGVLEQRTGDVRAKKLNEKPH